MRRAFCGLVPSLVLATLGCATDEPFVQRVPESPFGTTAAAPPPARATYAPAATAVAARVDTVGRNLLAANPQVGLRPMFMTIGSPKPEVFHRGSAEIGITEGLVKQCTTDAELAAVLSLELGKMVAEREALAGPAGRRNELPPPDVRIGNDSGGFYGSPDLTALAERAKFQTPAARSADCVVPEPPKLARDYLARAGYAPADLDTVEPLLRSAAANSGLERQLTNPGPARPYTK